MPKTGPSGVRANPTIAPLVSTTDTVTCAWSPKGRLIWARALNAIVSAFRIIVLTSLAVSASGVPSVPSLGENLGWLLPSTRMNAFSGPYSPVVFALYPDAGVPKAVPRLIVPAK